MVEELRRSHAEEKAAMAAELIGVEHDLLRRFRKQLNEEELAVRDMPGAIRNVATAAGIHEDKSLRAAFRLLTRGR